MSKNSRLVKIGSDKYNELYREHFRKKGNKDNKCYSNTYSRLCESKYYKNRFLPVHPDMK